MIGLFNQLPPFGIVIIPRLLCLEFFVVVFFNLTADTPRLIGIDIPDAHIHIGLTERPDFAVSLIELKNWTLVIVSAMLSRLQRALPSQISHRPLPFRAAALEILFQKVHGYVIEVYFPNDPPHKDYRLGNL